MVLTYFVACDKRALTAAKELLCCLPCCSCYLPCILLRVIIVPAATYYLSGGHGKYSTGWEVFETFCVVGFLSRYFRYIPVIPIQGGTISGDHGIEANQNGVWKQPPGRSLFAARLGECGRFIRTKSAYKKLPISTMRQHEAPSPPLATHVVRCFRNYSNSRCNTPGVVYLFQVFR